MIKFSVKQRNAFLDSTGLQPEYILDGLDFDTRRLVEELIYVCQMKSYEDGYIAGSEDCLKDE